MRKLHLILLILFLTGNFRLIFGWDSTAAKFYPLQIGNLWYYSHTLYGNNMCLQLPNPTYYTISIIGETIINNKKYYVFSNGSRERIDSASMNVYRYNGAFEEVLDSLLARKNDHFYGYRLDFFNSYCTLSDTGQYYFAGTYYKSKKITGNGNGTNEYYLVKGIGLTSLYKCFQSGYKDNLLGCKINGIQYGNISGINLISLGIPDRFLLYQNYPNPFNPLTSIKFDLPKSSFTILKIYDLLGKEAASILNQLLKHGTYEVEWDASSYPSGVYFYKLQAGDYIETKKMVLLK